MGVIAAVILWLIASSALLAVAYRRTLTAAWCEPVLRVPVLIFESDDWGYGPTLQAERLDRIANLLTRFHDPLGRHPVATLGVVLAGPDTERMRADECRSYHGLTLADARLTQVRQAMWRGTELGVFALQLHGMEHYWPACIMRSAAGNPRIREWLSGAAFPATEQLPSALQSRWIDAVQLPSQPLPADQAAAAATDEMRAFTALLGAAPEVVVPATFVWNDIVEAAWARAGARVVVTPGIRNEGRDAQGRVVSGGRTFFTGAIGPQDVTYVVRDCYLEPSLGQTHRDALDALRARARVGRAALIEIHRLNFLGDESATQQALAEMEQLLQLARTTFPDLRFMSTAELARECRERTALLDRRPTARVHFLVRRLARVSRLRKLAWVTGAALPVLLAYVLTRPRNLAPAAS
jgi:hypothetical protein